MKYIISGKNIEVTDGLRSSIYEKLDRLEKYFNPDTEVQVTFSVEKNRQKVEVTIPIKGNIIRAEQVSDDMYVSIDMVTEVIERQISRHKKKLVDLKEFLDSKVRYISNEMVFAFKENDFTVEKQK